MAFSNNGRIRVNVTGARGALGIELQGTPTPGEFLVKSPGGGRSFNTATGTGADAGLRADLAAASGSANIGYSVDSDSTERSSEEKLQENFSVNDKGAVGDNSTDNTAAINAAILELCKRGGGRLTFGSANNAYYAAGTIVVPSNIHIDLSGQTIRGAAGDLFQSGYFTGSAVLSNVNDGPEVNIVQSASIRNGNIVNAKRCWNLKNWNQKATIENIKTRDCEAVGYYKRCFSMSLIDIDARGGSSPIVPTHDFFDQTNSVKIDRIKCVTAWGMRFAGGANVVDIRGCEFEGGAKAITFEGDNLAITIDENYFEALTDVAIDVSGAGACSFNIGANYFNGGGQVFDAFRHGVASTATLHGVWTPENEIVNTSGGAKPNMRILGPRNFIKWNDRPSDEQIISTPSNWIMDQSTRYYREQRFSGNSLTDTRAVTKNYGGGIIPLNYCGDVGTPFPGRVSFCQYDPLPVGTSVTATLTTSVMLRDDASPIVFIISINDNVGPKKVSGFVLGNHVMQIEGIDRPVTLSQNGQGKAVLSIGNINNGNGAVVLTGIARLV